MAVDNRSRHQEEQLVWWISPCIACRRCQGAEVGGDRQTTVGRVLGRQVGLEEVIGV